MSSASAPGKIILFGEHAVVYGQPALAVPVRQVHADAEVTATERPGIWIDAPDIGLHEEISRLARDHPLAAVITGVLSAMASPLPQGEGVGVRVVSSIPVASGLGSGAAVSVAIIRALSAFLDLNLNTAEISRMAFDVEKIHHGTPSGIDNTVVTYARPVFFTKGQSVDVFSVHKPFTLVIGDTGIPAPTKESVGDVRRLWQDDPSHMEALFAAAGSIARAARQAIEGGFPERLGPLMDENHSLLQEMSVSSPELDQLVEAAKAAGATGAKLSGGGRGGNMIALVEAHLAEAVAGSLREAGAVNTIITQVE